MASEPEFRISFYWDSRRKSWSIVGRLAGGRVLSSRVENTVSIDEATAKLLMVEVGMALGDFLPI